MKNIFTIWLLIISINVFALPLKQEVSNSEYLLKNSYWKTHYQKNIKDAKAIREPIIFINPNSIAKNILMQSYDETSANYRNYAVYFESANFLRKARSSDLEIYNNLLKLKELETILFKRKKDKGKSSKLFENIEYYSDEDFKTKIDELPPVLEIPEKHSYYLKIKQIHLNNAKYRVDFYYKNKTFAIRIINLETLYFYGTKMNNPNELANTYILSPVDEGFLHIIDITGKINQFEQINKIMDINTFFSRRMEVIKAWFFKTAMGVNVRYRIKPIALFNYPDSPSSNITKK